MNFTFGITTTPQSSIALQQIVDSITNENIPNFEIIIVGGNEAYDDGTMKVIPFDESIKKFWITKKKNLITQHARYESIVYMHDYLVLKPGWYEGFLKFGNDFTICMTKVENADGTRYRDWCLYKLDTDPLGVPDPQLLLPYEFKNLSHLMYISGAYWIAKKSIAEKYPQNENVMWGDSEDIEWSKRARQDKFYMNEYSAVKLMKWKHPVFIEPTPSTYELLRKLNDAAGK